MQYMQPNEARMTPKQHAQHITSLLQQAQQECRADINRINDPRAQALFETIAEVIGGAMTALNHYQSGSEQAWQPSGSARSSSSDFNPPTVSDMRVDVDAAEPPP